jgi:hypothetical protein
MKPNIKIDKWDLNHVSSTQSVVNNWMTEYANLHLKNEINMDTTLVGTQSNESFPSLLPIAKKIAAQTIGIDLVTVNPMKGFGNSEEEKERIKREVATINRDRKLDSILENKEFEEFKEEEHELYKTGSSPNLFYFDYAYTTPSTQSTSTNYTPPINKRGKKKRTK